MLFFYKFSALLRKTKLIFWNKDPLSIFKQNALISLPTNSRLKTLDKPPPRYTFADYFTKIKKYI